MDVFDLFAKISLDSSEYDKGLDEAKSKGDSASSSIGSAFSKMGSILGGIGKTVAVGVGAASAGVIALSKESLDAYGNYEQLVGGVNKLYGNMGQSLDEYVKNAQSQGMAAEEAEAKWHYLEKAQTDVLENAKNAYKTSGLSANQYMETATSFSAALISSLEGDTVKAAEQTEVAMRAMSDNVNTFGTSMDSVQNAFMGFSKQNYTMLDNLKLGYGGTKKEMERLIEDANKYAEANGKAADLSIDSFSDIVTAIQYIQEEQNIAGTTAREAASTIQGSMAMTKSAWENLVAGFSNPDADLGQLISNVVDSATIAFGNLMPAIERGLEGIASFVDKIAPILSENLPKVFDTVLPVAIKALTSLAESLSKSLVDIINVLVEQIPTLVTGLMPAALQIIEQLGQGFITAAPVLLDAAIQILGMFGTMLIENLPTLVSSIAELISGLAQMISDNAPAMVTGAITLITTLATSLLENLPVVLEAILQIIMAVAQGLIENIPLLISSIGQILESIFQFFITWTPTFFQSILDLFVMIVEAIIEYGGKFLSETAKALGDLLAKVGEGMENVYNKVIEWISKLPERMAYWAGYAIGSFMKFILELPGKVDSVFTDTKARVENFGQNLWEKAKEIAKNFFDSIVNGIKDLPSNMMQLGSDLVNAIIDLPEKFMSIGSDIVNGLWEGIKGGWDWLTDQVASLADSLFQGAKDALGISSPSKKFMWIGEMSDKGLAAGLEKYSGLVDKAMEDITTVPDVDMGDIKGSSGATNTANTNVVINLYGVANEDLDTLAEKISRKIDGATGRRMVAMGVG